MNGSDPAPTRKGDRATGEDANASPEILAAAGHIANGGYARVAHAYAERGYAPLPVPAGKKASPPSGFTGKGGRWPDARQVNAWIKRSPTSNVALRLPKGTVGIDVDAYEGKPGARTLAALEAELGALPVAPRSTSRPDDPISGVRLFTLTEGTSSATMRDAGPGIETIRHEHRYMIVQPSLHPEGRRYGWTGGGPPHVADLPELPAAWLAHLLERPTTDASTTPAAVVRYDDLTEDRRDAGRAYVLATLQGVERDLRALRGHDEDWTDDRGRGYEKIISDAFYRASQALNSGIPDLDADGWKAQIIDAAPIEGGIDAGWLEKKWRAQEGQAAGLSLDLSKVHGGSGMFEPTGAGQAGSAQAVETGEHPVTPAVGGKVSASAQLIQIAQDQPADQRRLAHELVTRPEYRDTLRHVDGLGWLAWDGKRWQPGAEKQALAAVDRLLGEMWIEARGASKEEVRELRALQRASAMKGALTIAASLVPYSAALDDLDADPYLLNCANGTLDLSTDALRPHDPRDLITKVTRAAYHPDGATGVWGTFLQHILPSEPVRQFLQRYVGSALVGRVREHVLAIWTGVGGNGKGTTDRAILFALGDYATVAHTRVVMREEGNEYDKVALRSARWVTMSETERDKKMAESTMKALTGGDVIQARIPYQLPMRFRPSHTLSLITNRLPTVSGDDPAVWRRIRVIPFDVVVPEGEQDSKLDDRLELHADAVLAWAVAGYRTYLQHGLAAPAQVLRATEDYREQSDDVANFIDEECDVGPHLSASASHLYARYSAWAISRNLKPVSQTEFGSVLAQKGYDKKKAGHIIRLGLSLRNAGGWS